MSPAQTLSPWKFERSLLARFYLHAGRLTVYLISDTVGRWNFLMFQGFQVRTPVEDLPMTYVTPFAFLKQRFKISASDDLDRVNLSYRDFIEICRSLLRGVPVDEEWYFREYPDVAAAVNSGIFKSAKHHFLENGYFEGRRPARCAVDEEWYLLAYPDVSTAIEAKLIASAAEHFQASGYDEGRLPSEY